MAQNSDIIMIADKLQKSICDKLFEPEDYMSLCQQVELLQTTYINHMKNMMDKYEKQIEKIEEINKLNIRQIAELKKYLGK